MNRTFNALLLILMAGFLVGCGAAETVALVEANLSAELSNQMGDVMASIDEAGQGNTTIAQVQIAATCGASQFGSCSSNHVVRNFGGCSVGSYVLTGTVSMTWTGGTVCALTAAGQSIRIEPNYTIAGNNASLTTTKTGTNGITLTWDSGSGATKVFSYTNDGINRTLRYNDQTLLSIDTITNSAIVVNGTTRGARTLSNTGQLAITNNTSGETCTFAPNNISWVSTSCNCATSGQWIGNCSTTGSVILTLTGCGTGTVAYTENGDSKTQTVSLDRCVAD